MIESQKQTHWTIAGMVPAVSGIALANAGLNGKTQKQTHLTIPEQYR
jgi:hypothetical protein